MTIFGWDASHYDGELTDAILTRAKREGIEFFTHKIGEGLSNTDDTAKGALEAARNTGIRVIGAYYFIHSGDMVLQANRCLNLANQMVPWWKEFDGWFWQTDAETDTAGHLPSPAEVKLFSDVLAKASGKTVVVYASHGMYGDRLTGLGHPLWNANYPSNATGSFKTLYPGDKYSGWGPYSGQTPILAQYTSKATIAGLTTCDANAFRGTIDELLHIINPGGSSMTGDPITTDNIDREVWNSAVIPPPKDSTDQAKVSAGTALQDARDTAYRVEAAVNSLKTPAAGLTAADIRAIVREELAAAKTPLTITWNNGNTVTT